MNIRTTRKPRRDVGHQSPYSLQRGGGMAPELTERKAVQRTPCDGEVGGRTLTAVHAQLIGYLTEADTKEGAKCTSASGVSSRAMLTSCSLVS